MAGQFGKRVDFQSLCALLKQKFLQKTGYKTKTAIFLYPNHPVQVYTQRKSIFRKSGNELLGNNKWGFKRVIC
jgi:hypothetical protein